jgi:tRNA A37 threonylcarbamoyladenosine synthetase subunit TsaC/SUA5/YrdC
MEICSYDDTEALAEAVDVIRAGEVVGTHFGTVFGLLVDGSHAGVADEIMSIKGAARGHKPLAVATRPGRLVELIDVASLPSDVRRLTEEPWFGDQLAGMVAVRAPAAPDVAIPEHLVSELDERRWVQVFDPQRMPGASDLIAALWAAGVDWVAGTSMNESGQPEIVDLEDAVDFGERHGLPLLFQPVAMHEASGSLPIIELHPDEGLRLDRQGIIAHADLEHAVGEAIDASEAIPAHFPPLAVPPALLDGLGPADATAELLRLLYPLYRPEPSSA